MALFLLGKLGFDINLDLFKLFLPLQPVFFQLRLILL